MHGLSFRGGRFSNPEFINFIVEANVFMGSGSLLRFGRNADAIGCMRYLNTACSKPLILWLIIP
jgi:hypothetical protein